MSLTQDQPKTVQENRFLTHFTGTRNWLEQRLAGPPHEIWFTPMGVPKDMAVKAEMDAIDAMVEHIQYQMDSTSDEEEIRKSARRFALSQEKFFTVADAGSENDEYRQYAMLADYYKKMYLTLGIL